MRELTGLALGGGHAELLGGGGDEHLPRRGTGHGHPVDSRATNRRRAPRRLQSVPTGEAIGSVVECATEGPWNGIAGKRPAHVRVCVGTESRRLLHAHEIPVGVQFFGRHHGERGLRSLAHLAVRHQNGDDVVGRDQDPGRELFRVRRVVAEHAVPAGGERHARHAQHETAADEGADSDEGPPCPFAHRGPQFSAIA